MRGKEQAHYRYFPDPDLVSVHISEEWKEAVRATIPELPDARKARYASEYGLPDYDLASSRRPRLADFFEDSLN